MKKITTLLLLFFVTFTQAQLFSSIRTNGGVDHHTTTRTVTDWLHYDNGSNYTAFGASNGSHTLGAYIKLTQNLLAAHINRQIEEVKFYLGSDATNISGYVTIEIYTDPTAAPAYTENIPMSNLTAGDWNTVTLSTPFGITGAELYVGYKFTAAGYVIGVDDGSNYVQNVNYYTYDGGAMTSWDGVAAYNFNLQVGVGGATANNDAGVSNVTYQPITLAGTFNVEATITNYGSNTLNSIDFNYQVNGGNVYTDNLTGLNLATGQSTTVTHSVTYNLTPGTYNFDVYVSNFNGNGNDDIPANDHFTFTINVPSNSTQKLPLYEEFTSSTCSPCASFNSNSFNQSFLTNNAGHYSLIKYQMNWPGNGDPYYTAEGGTRRDYYSVSGVPTLFLDGSTGPDFFQNPSQLQPWLDNAYGQPAFFVMNAVHYIDQTNQMVYVNVDITPYITGDYTLHCAVVEKTTTNNATTNGETEFFNVMMKMVPDANGTTAALVADTPRSFNLSASLNNTFIEEWNDLEVIVFLQNDSNKEVMQSAVSIEDTQGIVDEVFNELKMHPVPAQNVLYINQADGMQMSIYDINGNMLFNRNNLVENNQIQLPELANGVYFVKFYKDNKTSVRKLIISK